jgi:hypothetical protein
LLTPSEQFIIYILIGLFVFLGIVSLFSFSFLIKRRKKRNSVPRHKTREETKQERVREINRRRNIGGEYMEKLGQKVVRYMVEISRSGDKNTVVDRKEKIIQECTRLNSLKLPAENKRIISTVLLWAKGFDAGRHSSEMKIFQHSSQIVYDPRKRDFQLRLFSK